MCAGAREPARASRWCEPPLLHVFAYITPYLFGGKTSPRQLTGVAPATVLAHRCAARFCEGFLENLERAGLGFCQAGEALSWDQQGADDEAAWHYPLCPGK